MEIENDTLEPFDEDFESSLLDLSSLENDFSTFSEIEIENEVEQIDSLSSMCDSSLSYEQQIIANQNTQIAYLWGICFCFILAIGFWLAYQFGMFVWHLIKC